MGTLELIGNLMELQKDWRAEIGQQQMPSQTDLDRYECSICKDQEIILCGEVVVECKCAPAKRIQRTMRSCNIGDEIKIKTFDTFGLDVDPAIAEIKRTCQSYTKGLVSYYERHQTLKGAPSFGLCGTSGLGKTHLITAIAGELISAGVTPVFFNWVSTFKEWMSWYDKDKIMVNRLRDKFCTADILIIDDLCKDCTKDTWVVEMYGIIDYRYRKQLPIIFTSEYYGELVTLLSEAQFGRLYEMTKNPKTGQHYVLKCFVKNGEDPLKYNYRLRGL